MTTLWHVNPETGEPGKCSAVYSCPFGNEFGHASTKREASKLYEDFMSNLHDPEGASYFYFIGDDDHTRYTNGECGLLARAMHEQTGWPIVGLGPVSGDESITVQHVAVRTPDGRLLDVTGVQPLSRAVLVWGNTEIGHKELDALAVDASLGYRQPLEIQDDTYKMAARLVSIVTD